MNETSQKRRHEATTAEDPLASGDVNDMEHVADVLMRLLTSQLRFRRYLQHSLGVDAAGLDTMLHLAAAGSDTPTAIARNLETSTAATSLVLNRLQAAGHISRRPHPTDRRKVVVEPARSSIASAYECAGPVIRGTERLAADLTPAERSAVAAFLEGIVHVYDDALRDAK